MIELGLEFGHLIFIAVLFLLNNPCLMMLLFIHSSTMVLKKQRIDLKSSIWKGLFPKKPGKLV